jgi:hypothetical protein
MARVACLQRRGPLAIVFAFACIQKLNTQVLNKKGLQERWAGPKVPKSQIGLVYA